MVEVIFLCLGAAGPGIQCDVVGYIFKVIFRRVRGRPKVKLIVTPTGKADQLLIYALERADQLRRHVDSPGGKAISVEDAKWVRCATKFFGGIA